MSVREVTYQLTSDDLASANRWAIMRAGAQCRLVAFWLGLTCAMTIYEAAESNERFVWTPEPLVAGCCLLVGYEAFLLVYVSLVSRRSFSRLEALRIPYTLKWDGANFEWVSERTRHTYKSHDIKRWAEKRDKFFIHTNDNMLWIVGKRFFETPEDMDSLRNELSRKER